MAPIIGSLKIYIIYENCLDMASVGKGIAHQVDEFICWSEACMILCSARLLHNFAYDDLVPLITMKCTTVY